MAAAAVVLVMVGWWWVVVVVAVVVVLVSSVRSCVQLDEPRCLWNRDEARAILPGLLQIESRWLRFGCCKSDA